ncbi:MAG: hypothetical protein ACK5TF_01785 [bacterium]
MSRFLQLQDLPPRNCLIWLHNQHSLPPEVQGKWCFPTIALLRASTVSSAEPPNGGD